MESKKKTHCNKNKSLCLFPMSSYKKEYVVSDASSLPVNSVNWGPKPIGKK